MVRKTSRLDAALLEMAQDMRGTLLSNETADAITKRVAAETLRAEIEAAEREGGRFTTDEVRCFARDRLDKSSSGS